MFQKCSISILQFFSSVVFQYCSVADTAELFIQCSFSVFHSGLTLCFTVFQCFSISIFLLSAVLHSGLTLPSALQLRSFLRRSHSIRGTRQDVAAIISRHAATKSKTGLTTSLLEYSWAWVGRGERFFIFVNSAQIDLDPERKNYKHWYHLSFLPSLREGWRLQN